MNYSNSENGFTLVELVLVMGIIGVLSFIAILAWRDMYSNYKVRGAVRQVYSDMQFARVQAIKTGKEILVDWESDAKGIYYQLKWKGGVPLPKRRGKMYLTGSLAEYKVNGLKVCTYGSPSDPPQDTKFNPNGSASGTVGIKVSAAGKRFRVYISSPGTGNVRILSTVDLEKIGDKEDCL